MPSIDKLVLPKDIVLMPVHDLPEKMRTQFHSNANDFALTRPQSRTPSKIIGSDAADLINIFSEPHTIIDAVISYSRKHETDPQEMLESAFPLIQSLMQTQLLVAPDSQAATERKPRFQPDDSVDEYTIVNCVQTLDDVEVYKVERVDGCRVALKIAQPDTRTNIRAMLEHELEILTRLGGNHAPRLLGSGEIEHCPYLLIEWCEGVDAATAAVALRQQPTAEAAQLLTLCTNIVDAYVAIHERGILHGDIHPRNLLITANQDVRVIDFGLAHLANTPDAKSVNPGRGGVGFFFEPEYAEATRSQQPPPSVTAASEQYAIAALLYYLIAGTHYLEFALKQDEMLRQIAQEPPQTFAERGVNVSAKVEAIFNQALQKDPAARFPSLVEFSNALNAAKATPDSVSEAEQMDAPDPKSEAAHQSRIEQHGVERSEQKVPFAQPYRTQAIDEIVTRVLQRVHPLGELFQNGLNDGPTSSLNFGAAGIAYALYRIGMAREDAELLSHAELWVQKAHRDSQNDNAFINVEMQLTPENVGTVSPYHARSGIPCVQNLIAHVLADPMGQQRAINEFMIAAEEPCHLLDATLGRASLLLAASLLLDTTIDASFVDNTQLVLWGNRLMTSIWDDAATLPAVGEPVQSTPHGLINLGMAHGWGGLLYTSLRWMRSVRAHGPAFPMPADLETRLDQLALQAEPHNRGARWRWIVDPQAQQGPYYMPAWCNGSSGLTFLWTLAHEMLGQESYLKLAELSTYDVIDTPCAIGNLCCGYAGNAYTLFNIYRHTGDASWLYHAQELTQKATESPQPAEMPINSLYKGDIGIAILCAEADSPHAARMPFFEAEGWR